MMDDDSVNSDGDYGSHSSVNMNERDIFRAMSVWHCLNCIQLNQADDEACIECNTPRGEYGLKPCGCARKTKLVSRRWWTFEFQAALFHFLPCSSRDACPLGS